MMRPSIFILPLLLLTACPDENKPFVTFDLSHVPDFALANNDLSESPDMAMPMTTEIDIGFIGIGSYSYTIPPGGLIAGGVVSASFTTTIYGAGLTCLKSTVAGCQVQHCSGNLFDVTQTDNNAGPITVTIGAKTYTIAADPDMGNNYSIKLANGGVPLFNAGDSIVVTPTGAAAVTLTGIAEPTLTSPTIPAAGTPLAIDSSTDETFLYTGDFTSAEVRTQLSSGTATTSTIITCESNLAASITVAKAVLQELDKGPNANLSITIYTASPSFMLAGHPTTAQASTSLLLPAGGAFQGTAATVN